MTQTNEPFESEGYSTAYDIQEKIYSALSEFDTPVITNFFESDDGDNYIIMILAFSDGERYGSQLALSKNPSEKEIDTLPVQIGDVMRAIEEAIE